MKISKILASVAVASIAAGAVAATAGAYNAALSFQNGVYTFREMRTNSSYGEDSAYWADKVIMWGGNSETTWPDLIDNFDWDINGYVFDADYTDVDLDSDGTYTVAAGGFDWAQDGCTNFKFIKVTTDIPFDAFDPEGDPTAFVTSATLYVDGVAQTTIENPIPEKDGDYLSINIVNSYNPDMESYTGAYPTESITVDFTIEGLGGDSADGSEGGDSAGSTDGASDGDNKNSADTGVEGVAAVAGLAIVAGGAMLLSKKRK
ncbi:MAG: LPXTG cell wall anchor domain-containing protein [Ruminococcaceae bacterium]|nr:LPXTG cell wall anchor domain-containing protein [Oscillospiraceae bacterium]